MFETSNTVWETIEKLFTIQFITRLQLLENELVLLAQGNMSHSQYLLKVNDIYVEILELDAGELVSEAQLWRCLIIGLKEYMPFITFLQGWTNQLSIIKLGIFLSNQEPLAGQMSNKYTFDNNEALFKYENGRRNTL